MYTTVRLDGDCGGTAEPYLGRHRKVPSQIGAASRFGRRLVAVVRRSRFRLAGPLAARPEAADPGPGPGGNDAP